MRKSLAFLIIALMLLSGCVLFGIHPRQSFDDRSFSILSLNLFNQKIQPNTSTKSWRGDWLLRRERLELIDEQLRISRPDIIIFQDLLTRRDSPSESDINILSYGALEGYEWDARVVDFIKETQEVQYNAAAAGLPVKLKDTAPVKKKMWPIGVDGYMSYHLLELDEQPILVVNIEMPAQPQKADYWYRLVRTEIRQLLAHFATCPQRLIVAGHLPGGSVWVGYSEFLAELQLRDTASGFCEAASDCLTTNTQNDLFMATSQGQAPSHSERILVHVQTQVMSSSIVMQKMRERTVYGAAYGIHRLFASPSFGWQTQVRLARCPATKM